MPDKQPLLLLRVYDDHSLREGTAVLADRLWPRGVKKDEAGFDAWARDITPSTELRQWYHGNPESFAEFGERYRAELALPAQAAALDEVRELLKHGPVTLLTAAKRIETSHLEILRAVLEEARQAPPALRADNAARRRLGRS